MRTHGLFNRFEGLLEEVCFFGYLFLEVSHLMNAFADESLEAADDLRVERMVSLNLVYFLGSPTDGTLVLLLSLNSQRDGGHQTVDHIKVFEMVRKNLVDLGKNLLHQQQQANPQQSYVYCPSSKQALEGCNKVILDQQVIMRNFIRHNIENVKGKKAVSIERQNPKQSHIVKSIPPRNLSIADRVTDLERRVREVETGPQQQIIEQLSIIKEDIRLIKSHIFDRKFHSSQKQMTQQSQQEEGKQRMRSQNSQLQSKVFERSHPSSSKHLLSDLIQTRLRKSHSNYHRGSMNLKTICSMVRDYKFEQPDFGTVFYGYSKRNSQPVALKYAADGLGPVLEVYDRLWKNIAKAKWPCVNRVLDFKREDSTYMIIERNRGNIVGLPPKSVLIDILKILQFIHDCGYLYRNVEPQHFMINEEGQLVAIDFKRALRYVDIKGHPLEVVDQFNGSPFASNNQLRGLPESRKDDLQSLGYLALLLLELDIPWLNSNKEQAIKIRCSLTLQELYKNNIRWVEYMANVFKIPKGERPDYKHLLEILEHS